MVDIPKIKKKVNAFLVGEEGKISKESLIKTGALLSMFALGALKSAKAGCPLNTEEGDYDHCNDMAFIKTGPKLVTAEHQNSIHQNAHSSHNSHNSHGSHLSW
ncbi:hypothetical protein KY331_01910 [Candidatus Woesearchaeota archaeon]|nr:hypothetical protein [Candidatus Woesearchaeota archaeon]